MLWSDLKTNTRLKEIYDSRLKIVRLIREFFWSAGFEEADTPIAVKYPGQEPYLNPVPVSLHNPAGEEHKFYLHTSPEFAMKKLLAAGYPKIFQICKTFRDFEQFGGLHNPEFTMIEWYRAPGTLEEIMDDTEALFKYVGKELGVALVIPPSLRGDKGGSKIDISGQWDRLSMRHVWQKYIGVELNDYLSVVKMQELMLERGYNFQSEVYEDLFFKIFLNEIESKLGMEKPVMIYDYPEQMTSLSRLSAVDPRYAERFELYIAGIELANAYGELTDPVEQKKRLEADREKRQQLGKETWPVDSDFISALESGISSAGGIALGIDRMVMLFTGAKDIDQVIFQSAGDVFPS
jgi:lysyl-tRNA synthetase class 2